MKVDWDQDELQAKLSDLFASFFMGDLDGNTPMNEVRARAELAGAMLGRTLAVVQHEGPVETDIAVTIRYFEQRFGKEIADRIGSMGAPGGQLRDLWTNCPGSG